ncbi:MAG TPA: peptidoglycan recognition family protein [Saprospiraceae bacterium]|nr:peptidoglycan recognition family protein [Saprospiraceae bacterium]
MPWALSNNMQKWQKTIVVFGVVITLALLVRRAKAEDIAYRQLLVKDLTGKLPRGKGKSYEKRALEQIDRIVIHHSATNDGSPEAYALYHVETRGWPGIGYHFVIQKDGGIYQTNRLETISYHVSGQNTNSIGICLTGNYDQQQPPIAQLQACAQLIASLRQNFVQELTLRAHADFSAKSCPGKNINLEEIGRLAAAYATPLSA